MYAQPGQYLVFIMYKRRRKSSLKYLGNVKLVVPSHPTDDDRVVNISCIAYIEKRSRAYLMEW